jgi:hypothetical protein
MKDTIYGIDPENVITPLMVRDATVECFFKAHCMDSGIDPKEEGANRNYCREIVKKAFSDSGGHFNQPTKESIMRALEKLADFAKSFRDPSVIQEHYREIIKLVDQLKD